MAEAFPLKCVIYVGNLPGVWEHQNPSISWTGRQITKARYDRRTSPGEEINRSSFLVVFPNARKLEVGWGGWRPARHWVVRVSLGQG